MTIAIVIGTHGWAAEQLLKTAEMLLGEQENVGWIDFVPGENAETRGETDREGRTNAGRESLGAGSEPCVYRVGAAGPDRRDARLRPGDVGAA